MINQLSIRIKAGDEQAFELLFRKYYVRLYGFAKKFSNDSEEARDVTQEVFTTIWEGRGDIDPEESISSYLFRICRNICINKLRRKKVESKYIEIYKIVYVDYNEVTPYESLLAHELNDKIPTAVSKIPNRCRRIFELSRVEGLKYSEIAELLHISVKTVETQMSKALFILRLELRDYIKVMRIK